jgi:signal transduction histidine kinase/DNA-binding response OmpR family regulator
VKRTKVPIGLYLLQGALAVGVLIADLATPLGVAVWILYIIPVGLAMRGSSPIAPLGLAGACTGLMVLTFLTDEPGLAPWAATVNRVCGVAVVWTIAVLTGQLVSARNAAEDENWIKTAEGRLFADLQGDLSLAQIAERALGILSEAFEAPVAALYSLSSGELRLAGTRGLREGVDVPTSFQQGEGVVGQAALSRGASVLRDLPPDFFSVRSAFMGSAPRHIVVMPLRVDNETQGVVELGVVGEVDQKALQLLERASHGMAVAIRSATYRSRLRELLQQTQRQAEELQSQQEELRVTNEELEEQSRALQESQSRLEQQQSELEATNAQLETQTQDLEQQQLALTVAKQDAERASRYKSEFLANMSHELRTPLNSILILAKLLAQNGGGRLSEEQVRYADTIHQSGSNLLTLINDILDLSKIEAGAVELEIADVSPRALVESLHRAFEPAAKDKDVDFTCDVAPTVPDTIASDQQRVHQILSNLLSNAIKFTDRGQVSLRVTAEAGGQLAFAVQDTGVGISAEKQSLIFEAFRQADGTTHRRFGGTGLGLSISLELARLLGGDIRVESEVGRGSTFTLLLPTHVRTNPLARPATPRPRPRPESRSGATGPRRVPAAGPVRADANDDRLQGNSRGRMILVVEDDVAFARILYDLAHDLGFDCVLANTTDEGMALARELSPSGILLDVNLPDGSGLTLLDRLKRNPDTRHIPVHMISVSDHAQMALELGAVGFATKPIERDELVATIRRLEDRLAERVRRILVVEDDPTLRSGLLELLKLEGVSIDGVGTARDALERLALQSYDCVVLDLNLPDVSGYEMLEKMSANEQYSFPPVIVYTGRVLEAADEERLRRYSRSIIIKGAKSPERLLDEVTLFLHQVESRLPPESQRLLRAARERDGSFEGKTILLVEDDVRNVFALTSVLEARGAVVAIARNGREGIEAVKAKRPDLVLMDIMMPEMDGLTAMRELRKEPDLQTLPIIALTAKAMRNDYEDCLAAGANDYMSKPIDIDKLVSLCRVWMKR